MKKRSTGKKEVAAKKKSRKKKKCRTKGRNVRSRNHYKFTLYRIPSKEKKKTTNIMHKAATLMYITTIVLFYFDKCVKLSKFPDRTSTKVPNGGGEVYPRGQVF